MDEKDEAITELAHVANCLLERLKEIDPHVPRHGVIAYSIENKINFYKGVADDE